MKKKTIIITVIVILLFVLLFPIKLMLKDGGTVEYKAILYTVTKRQTESIDPDDPSRIGLYIGTEIKILFWEVYNDVEFFPDETTGEE